VRRVDLSYLIHYTLTVPKFESMQYKNMRASLNEPQIHENLLHEEWEYLEYNSVLSVISSTTFRRNVDDELLDSTASCLGINALHIHSC
jgi:hypothetical protein